MPLIIIIIIISYTHPFPQWAEYQEWMMGLLGGDNIRRELKLFARWQ